MFKKCPICNWNIQNKYNKLFWKYSLFKCLNCGLEFINPQPTESEIEAIYSEAYYKAWWISWKEENEFIKEMKKQTFSLRLDEILKYKKYWKILDIWCATWFFLEKAQELWFDPYGIELSEYSSEIAKSKFWEDKIYNWKIENVNFENNFFDVICMSDLVEHVQDPIVLMEKCKDLLKDDWIIMIMTPDTDSLSAKIMWKYWTQYKNEHLFYFNKKSLSTLIENKFVILHSIKAYKYMNLHYFYTQFLVYKNKIITPIMKFMKLVIPNTLLHFNFKITLWERVWILKKK